MDCSYCPGKYVLVHAYGHLITWYCGEKRSNIYSKHAKTLKTYADG